MRQYRVYCFAGTTRIVSADWIEAVNDAEAVQTAKNQEGWLGREIWDRNRLVGRIGPERSLVSLLS
jgi:hypothetical protein